MSDSKKPFEVPSNYRIVISDGPDPLSKQFKTSECVSTGKKYCYMEVYERLDCGCESKLGQIKLDDLGNKSALDLIEGFEEGIEELLKPEECKTCKGRFWKE